MKKIIILLCLLFLLVAVSCEKNPSYRDAFDAVKQFVYTSSDYDAPYGAVFCSYSENRVEKIGDSMFIVKGYYTDKNGRNKRNYTVYINYTNKTWKVGTHY